MTSFFLPSSSSLDTSCSTAEGLLPLLYTFFSAWLSLDTSSSFCTTVKAALPFSGPFLFLPWSSSLERSLSRCRTEGFLSSSDTSSPSLERSLSFCTTIGRFSFWEGGGASPSRLDRSSSRATRGLTATSSSSSSLAFFSSWAVPFLPPSSSSPRKVCTPSSSGTNSSTAASDTTVVLGLDTIGIAVAVGVDAACFDLDMNPANLDDSFVLSEVLTPRVGISFSLDPAAGSTNFSESSVGGGGGGGGESVLSLASLVVASDLFEGSGSSFSWGSSLFFFFSTGADEGCASCSRLLRASISSFSFLFLSFSAIVFLDTVSL